VRGRGVGLGTHTSAWAAVVADVEVDKKTGRITAKHMYAAMDSGLAINPGLIENQIVGQQTMGVSRALHEEILFSKRNVTSLDWVTYPLLRFKDHPKVTPIVVNRPDQRPDGAGEETMAPVPAAIANAFFDATGVRLYQHPMTPAVVRAALKAASVK
jgi:CO/xanthine dehydrogenase Mo-binding subunit